MPAKHSSGLLLYRRAGATVEVLLVHMGGPLWARRDAGAWTIPKGEHDGEEDSLAAARREFAEETGLPVPAGEPQDLGVVRQSGGKLVHGWALAADVDASSVQSNTFTLEWPRGSGAVREFPEIDRAEWFPLARARSKIVKAQAGLLEELERRLIGEPPG